MVMRFVYTTREKILIVVNAFILILFAFFALVPLLAVVSTSLSSKIPVDMNQVSIWPIGFTFDSWKYILGRADLWRSFIITLISTVVGTFLALLVTALFAYPLSKKEFRLGSILMLATVITMIFKAPVVPFFLTVRGMGLFNNPLVLVIPHILSAYNVAIMRTFFKQFPAELEEAGVMEGCGYFQLLFRLVLPSSKAVLATIGLFYAVVIWNQFQTPLLFIQDARLFPLQMKIRQFMVESSELPSVFLKADVNYNDRTIRSATVVFAIIPVISIYPFIQKYFVKGAMIGSIKG